MKFVIFGLSITSAWGNGHASTYRALARALHGRGHHVVFFEHDLEWYRDNRDLPRPDFCELRLFESWRRAVPAVRRELRAADVAIVGSYFPDAIAAAREVLDSAVAVKAFYDIDTPITLAALRERGEAEYLRAADLPGFDLYLSFTGGPVLGELQEKFGARLAVPLYCSFDPSEYRPRPHSRRYACDLSYMGTYAPDRQPKLEQLLCEPARCSPRAKFLVAGPQYPKAVSWPGNVRRIVHLNPRWHPLFYSSSRITLNLTRRDMVQAGWSPSVRLFEAAACGATIASDAWPGLDTFFAPGHEILLPASADDVARFLTQMGDGELQRIGAAARERVLSVHTSDHRARELERLVERVHGRRRARQQAVAS